MTELVIICKECGQVADDPIAKFSAKALGKGATVECKECGGQAIVTAKGTEPEVKEPTELEKEQVLQENKEELEESIEEAKFERAKLGDTVRLSGTVEVVVEFTRQDFTGKRAIIADGDKQWLHFKNLLHNDRQFAKNIFLNNVFADDFDLEIQDETFELKIEGEGETEL